MSFHVTRFARSAATYESQARIQHLLAERLLALWDKPSEPSAILELGCGTGLLTRRLLRRFPGAHVLATDGAWQMLAQARLLCASKGGEKLSFALQDAEGGAPAEPELWSRAPYGLVTSSALVQWFPDIERHLRFVAGLVGPEGFYLVSSFTDSNFPELNALLASPPFCYRNFPGLVAEKLDESARRAGFTLQAFQETEDREVLPTPRMVLKRIQSLGASRNPRDGGRLTKATLEGLLDSYADHYGERGGVRLTWKSCVALLRRSSSGCAG